MRGSHLQRGLIASPSPDVSSLARAIRQFLARALVLARLFLGSIQFCIEAQNVPPVSASTFGSSSGILFFT